MRVNFRKYSYIKFVVLSLSFFSLVNCSEEKIIKNNTEENSTTDQHNNTTFVFEEPSVSGNTFYLDPINGSIEGDGSKNKPWPSLKEVIKSNLVQTFKKSQDGSKLIVVNKEAPIKGGDRLILKNGYHGNIFVKNFYFKNWLTIEGATGEKPVLSFFHLIGLINNVYIKNISFARDSYQGVKHYSEADVMQKRSKYLVFVGSNSFFGDAKNVKIYGCNIKTTDDTSNWDIQKWRNQYGNGIYVRRANNIDIINCNFKNIGFAMSLENLSENLNIVGNTIKNYCRDAVRIAANNVLFENNNITNLYNINSTSDTKKNFHYDGIQLYSRDPKTSKPGKGTLKNVIIRGNYIYDDVKSRAPGAIDESGIQGIGAFDGFYDNFVIENNVVAVSHHHGITLLGAINSKIINNTVVDTKPDDKLKPSIRIRNHKNKTESKNCEITNNITVKGIFTAGNTVKENNNLILNNSEKLKEYFKAPSAGDYHLSNSELAKKDIINKGIVIKKAYSSKFDKDGVPRKEEPDLGAYEKK